MAIIRVNIFTFSIFVFLFVDPTIISKSEQDLIQSITPAEWLEFTKRGIESNNQEKRFSFHLKPFMKFNLLIHLFQTRNKSGWLKYCC